MATAACLIVLFVLSAWRGFSNVLSLNCVRVAGLGWALVSVGFGVYIQAQSASQCSDDDINTVPFEAVSNTTFLALSACLVAVLVLGVVGFFWQKRHDWHRRGNRLATTSESGSEQDHSDVTFSSVRSHIQALLIRKTNEGGSRQMKLQLTDAQKARQIEDTTIQMLLYLDHVDLSKRFTTVLPRTTDDEYQALDGGELVCNALTVVLSVWLWESRALLTARQLGVGQGIRTRPLEHCHDS